MDDRGDPDGDRVRRILALRDSFVRERIVRRAFLPATLRRRRNDGLHRWVLAVSAGLILGFAGDAEARIHRSYQAKAEFKRAHHCPSTGLGRGPCPGWQIDHRIPLKCHGDDTPSNMQWLTIADHAAKTYRERLICRP